MVLKPAALSRLFLALLLTFCFAFSQPLQAQSQTYEIAAGPLEDILIDFAERARLSISFSGLDLSGLPSKGTSGHSSKRAALRAILEDTGLSYRRAGRSMVRLYRLKAEGKPAPTEASNRPDAADTADLGEIEDLIVTATKRSSRAFSLPVSVTAVSSLMLQDLNVNDLQSLSRHVAGFDTTNLGPGRNKVFVRGLSDGPFSDRTQALVGVYIDETPVNLNDTNPDVRLIDIDRLELVRGPHGTLYGAGSLGGLYRVITNKPVLDETSGSIRLTGSSTNGGGENGQIDAAFNMPLVPDKVGFRIAAYLDERSGYIDQLELDIEDSNAITLYGARPSLRFQFDETWSLDLASTLQFIRQDDSQYFIESLGRNRRTGNLTEPYTDDFVQTSLTLHGQIGASKLTSATSYIDRVTDQTTDATNALSFFDGPEDFTTDVFVRSDIAQFGGAAQFLRVFGNNVLAFFTRNDIQTLSHETRLQSVAGQRLEWVAGLYYLWRQQDQASVLVAGFEDEEGRAALTEDRTETTQVFAAFGELVYHVTDKFSLTGGLRLSRDSLELEYESIFAPTDQNQAIEDKKVAEKLVPKLAAQYTVNDDILAYAQFSRGYRVGGLNINTPLDAIESVDPEGRRDAEFVSAFRSDNLTNYEVGFKSYWLDRRLAFNSALYHVRWSDIQSDQIGPSGLAFVTNIGNARIWGFELEMSVNPIPGLELWGHVFWNDSKLLTDNPFLDIEQGDRLPTVAKTSFSVSGLYQFEVADEWNAPISADYAHSGETDLSFSRVDRRVMGGFGLLNARIQVSNRLWAAGIFGQNLTDSFQNSFAFGNGFTFTEENQNTPPRPRTIGLFLERKF